ncbi:MAG: twin-arginine translocase subunit TatC, partial [Candidatus Thorarchaeota archaeon]
MSLDERISENILPHSQELYYRLRLIVIVFILSLIIIMFFPYDVLLGDFSFSSYKPLVVAELEWVLKWITSQINTEHFLLIIGSPMAVILAYFELGIITTFAINYPFIIWQLYLYLKPGLYEEEKSFIRSIIFFATILFVIGVLFGFFMMPSILQTLVGIGNLEVNNIGQYYALSDVIEFFFWSVVSTGILFTYPLFILLFVLFGFIDTESLRKRRRHIIVALMGITAIITPDPSPISMLILSVPLVFLYEITINLSYKIEKTPF